MQGICQTEERFLTFQQIYSRYESQLAAFYQQQAQLEGQRERLREPCRHLRDQWEDLERVKRELAAIRASHSPQPVPFW